MLYKNWAKLSYQGHWTWVFITICNFLINALAIRQFINISADFNYQDIRETTCSNIQLIPFVRAFHYYNNLFQLLTFSWDSRCMGCVCSDWPMSCPTSTVSHVACAKRKKKKKNIHTQQYARYCCLSISTDHLHGPSKCWRFLDLHRTADARPALNKRCVSHFVQVV